MKSIEELILDLSWHNTKDVQSKAIYALVSTDLINPESLIMPNGKECWENAALVLSQFEEIQIHNIVPKLLVWLQDLNWPGSQTILKMLSEYDETLLKKAIDSSINEAQLKNDEDWIENLGLLLAKLEEKKR